MGACSTARPLTFHSSASSVQAVWLVRAWRSAKDRGSPPCSKDTGGNGPSVGLPGGSSSLPALFWGLSFTSFLDSNAKAGETFPMLHNFFSPCLIFLILSPPFFFTCWVEGLSLILTVPAEVVRSEVPTKESLCAHGFGPDSWPVCLPNPAQHRRLARLQAPAAHHPSPTVCCPSLPSQPPSLTHTWVVS